MPLKGDAKKVMKSMKKQYGDDAESVFYATANKQGRKPETWKKKKKPKKKASLISKLAKAKADGRLSPKQEKELGTKEELEHTSDKEEAADIAQDHLDEDSNYYEKMQNAGLLDAKLASLRVKLAKRCWKGYEPVPGKKPYSEDSCRKKSTKDKAKKASVGSFPKALHRKLAANLFRGVGRRALDWAPPVAAGAGFGTLGYLRSQMRPEVQEANRAADPVARVGSFEDYNVTLTPEDKATAAEQGISQDAYANQIRRQRYDEAIEAARSAPSAAGGVYQRYLIPAQDTAVWGLLGAGLGSRGFRNRLFHGGRPGSARTELRNATEGVGADTPLTTWARDGDSLVFRHGGGDDVRVRLDSNNRPIPADVEAASRQLADMASHESLFRAVGQGVGGKAALLGLNELSHLAGSLSSAGGQLESTLARAPEIMDPLVNAAEGLQARMGTGDGTNTTTVDEMMNRLSSLGDIGPTLQEGMETAGRQVNTGLSRLGTSIQSAANNPYVLAAIGTVGLGGLLTYLLHRRSENQRRRELLRAIARR